MFYEIRNIKPCYQGLMLRFSCNDPNQRYYLNGMWTCGSSELLSPKGLRIKILIVTSSRIVTTIRSNFNRARTLVGVPSKEVVPLTFPPHIFSVQGKSGACYITGQWGRVQNKIKET